MPKATSTAAISIAPLVNAGNYKTQYLNMEIKAKNNEHRCCFVCLFVSECIGSADYARTIRRASRCCQERSMCVGIAIAARMATRSSSCRFVIVIIVVADTIRSKST